MSYFDKDDNKKIKLSDIEKQMLMDSMNKSLDDIHLPKDKYLREKKEIEKKEFNYDNMTGVIFLQEIHKFFLLKMKELNLNNNNDIQFTTKLLFMFVSFIISEISRTIKNQPVQQINFMSELITNVIITLRFGLDNCHPEIKESIGETLPIVMKTLLLDPKLNSNDQYHAVDLFHKLVRELDNEQKIQEQEQFEKKFWKDDVYGK